MGGLRIHAGQEEVHGDALGGLWLLSMWWGLSIAWFGNGVGWVASVRSAWLQVRKSCVVRVVLVCGCDVV